MDVIKPSGRPRVVIVGAGFGGLWSARTLSRSPAEVILLDRSNFHTFLPLLYQVAAAELEPEDIAYPVRSILRKIPNARFTLAEITGVNLSARQVTTARAHVAYDYLILAVGSSTNFFGVPGAEEHAFSLKTLDEGIALRNHILGCFERAADEGDAEKRCRALTFTIVGGGPTGVEFAGALAELVRSPMKRDYPGLDFREVRVVLLEAMSAALSIMPERLGEYAVRRLRAMDVDVRLGAAVARVTGEEVTLTGGTCVPTETVVWTAGVRGVPQAQAWGLPCTRTGQVDVLPTLQVPGHPEAYVIGDLAHVVEGGRPLPLIAPVAIQEGVAAARNIARQISGEPPLPFRYKDKGSMVTIGRNSGVAFLGGRTYTGFPAWMVWLTIHIINLIGFRNRLIVLINWAWDYFFYERAVRLILR